MSPAVVGGTQISITQAPWAVAVTASVSADEVVRCSGSILSETEVLTAAHCVFDEAGNRVSPSSIYIQAGVSNFNALEIEQQEIPVKAVRVHPYYVRIPDATEANPDDVAVLELEAPIELKASAEPIALAPAGSLLAEETAVNVAGFGEEDPLTKELNGTLNLIGMKIVPSHECGGESDALFVCARAPGGSVCFGDSGSGLTIPGSPAALDGVTNTVEEKCANGALGGFANVAAPEIRDFIEGNEAPPKAPRGGLGLTIRGVVMAGHPLICEPGSWTNDPTVTYTYIDSTSGGVLQSGSSDTYSLTAADVGRTILCQVQAANAGGTAIVRSMPLQAVEPAPLPTITSVDPESGPTAGGTAVTITGTNLTGATAVKFGTANATSFKVESANEIIATSPPGSGTVDVTATTAGGTTATASADRFTYVPPPSVTSINPTQGSTAGATTVTITGTNLTGATAVKFGTANATSFKVESANEIIATSPPGLGTVDVTATTPGGTTTTGSPDRFTYVVPPPSVTSINPTQGPTAGGTAVTIKGTGFVTGATVKIGTAATSVSVLSPGELTATTVATAAGADEVIVTDANGTSSAGPKYTYVAPVPTVTKVDPASGSTAGGTAVTITGTNLTGATAVKFGTANATSFKVESANEIIATSPPGLGTVDVTATTPGGTTATGSPDRFTYVVPPPSVTSINPTQGPTAGGTAVTIKGTGFVTGATVKIGTAATSVSVLSPGELTATTVATAAGADEVIVTDANGTSSAGPKYTYVAPAAENNPPLISPIGSSPIGGPSTTSGTTSAAPGPAPGSTISVTGNVSLMATSITVQGNGTASVKVGCAGSAVCHGKLTLSTKSTVDIKGKQTLRTVPIGTASFSVPGGRSKTVAIKLGPVGRGLLSSHGRLSARLSIVKLEPGPRQSQVKPVQLILQRAHSSTK